MKKPSNTELVLLQILNQEGEVSGYKINKLVVAKGYRDWANVGTTSIYNGLNKLEEKGLVQFRINMEKQGKGAVPRLFRITAKGLKVLIESVVEVLSDPKSDFVGFSIALGGLPVISNEVAIGCLEKRKKGLLEGLNKVKEKFILQGGEELPFHTKKLFEYSFSMMDAEVKHVRNLISELKNI